MKAFHKACPIYDWYVAIVVNRGLWTHTKSANDIYWTDVMYLYIVTVEKWVCVFFKVKSIKMKDEKATFIMLKVLFKIRFMI